MRAKYFDRSRLRLAPLAERSHDLTLSVIREKTVPAVIDPAFRETAAAMLRAREAGASVLFMMGAHVIRSGVQAYLLDLMEQGLITCLAGNGACAVHDFELALVGATTESVARYVKDGRFGLWTETGRINDVVAAADGMGAGEALGRAIEEDELPYRGASLYAAAWRLGIAATVHAGIGCDIVHEHPNCDGAAWGRASYLDFLRLTSQVEGLEHGVVMNFGSAVTAPEVFLKALAMVRNAGTNEGFSVSRFTALVCDLAPLPEDIRAEPCKTDPRYYFRPWKTMLVRTVADGGQSFYVRGRHDETVPQLWAAVRELTQGS